MAFSFRYRKSRTIFIGDVHGCLEELQAMITRLKVTDKDRVIMLGDLINRGPNSAGVVRFVHNAGFESLMGNHEDEYLAEFRFEDRYARLREELGHELHDWIQARPLYIEGERFMAVHAGLEPGRHPSKSRRNILLNIRTWDGSGMDMKNLENPPWYELYQGKRPVFYGHWARQGLNIRRNTIGLDSGVVYGRKLSAYILEEKKLVQVDAFKVHYIPPSLRAGFSG